MAKVFYFILTTFALTASTIHSSGYTVKDLGLLYHKMSAADQLNNHNWVVGSAFDVDNALYDFIWRPDEDLASLYPCSYDRMVFPRLNNHNQIVGLYPYENQGWLEWLLKRQGTHIFFRNTDGQVQYIDIASLLWDQIGIMDFNDLGQILVTDAHFPHARFAIWENGAFHAIDHEKLIRVWDINNQGILLGSQRVIDEKGEEAVALVLYDRVHKTSTPITTQAENLKYAALNDQGHVIGIVTLEGEPSMNKGFLWEPGKGMTEFEDFIPCCFNNFHQMVVLKDTRYLLWDKGEIIDISEVIEIGKPDCPWTELNWLGVINDQGAILGQGLYNGERHAFLLIPTQPTEAALEDPDDTIEDILPVT